MRALSFAVSILLVACSRPSSQDATFTLESGVTLVASQCEDEAAMKPLSLRKEKDAYLLTISSMFPCGAELDAPFLTVGAEKKATLVLKATDSRWGFHSGCECARTLNVQISGRLQAGDTVYVLNDYEVLGHFSLPEAAPQ